MLIVTLDWCVLGYKALVFCGFLTCRCCTYSYHGYAAVFACTPNSIELDGSFADALHKLSL